VLRKKGLSAVYREIEVKKEGDVKWLNWTR